MRRGERMAEFLGIVLIAVIVTIDNALLAGLLVPLSSHRYKRAMLVVVGILLGVSQIFLAVGVDKMLHNLFFRLIAIGLLGWMCVRTLGMYAMRGQPSWPTVLKLWVYTTIGNLDNMFWLGSVLKGDRLWVILSSLGTIPLFVAVALFLSDQCEKQTWILPLGAGMMAWAAASLTLDTPGIRVFIKNLDDAPRTTIQCLITIGILVLGLGFRKWLFSRSRSRQW